MTTIQSLSPRSQAAWDAFRARVEESGAELVEAEWLGALRPHRIRCAVGHENSPTPNNVQRGRGICRTCAGIDPRVSEAAFRARVTELGGEVLEPEWLGVNMPHRVRCSAGHLCSPRPSDVQRGKGVCRTCVGTDPQMSWAWFRARVEELGGEVLEEEYLGSHIPHRIRCAAGHEGNPRPNNVRRQDGICRTCAGNDSQASWAEFRAKIAERGAVLLEEKWLGTDTPHRVRCSAGHVVTPRPHGVLQGGGICRVCAGKSWNVFYVVADDEGQVVKFGISGRAASRRLTDHRRDGFARVIRLHVGLPGATAPDLERACLAALRDAGEHPVRGREYYPARALALILDVVDGHLPVAA